MARCLAILAAPALCACREPNKQTTPGAAASGVAVPAPAATSLATLQPSEHRSPARVYRSIDEGRTWSPLSSGIPDAAIVRNFVARGDTTFVATEKHGVYALERGASAWQPRSDGLPPRTTVTSIGVMEDRLLVGTHAVGVLVSTDDGRHWRVSGDRADGAAGLAGNPVRSLLAVADRVLAGTDAGVHASTDRGAGWSHVFGEVQVNGLTVAGDKVYAAVVGGALLSTDHGATWAYIYRGDTLHDIASDGAHVYAMALSEGLLRTGDDGKSWVSVNEGLPAKERAYTFQVKSVGDDLLAAHWGGIYRSLNRGATWIRIDAGLPATSSYPSLAVTPLGVFAGAR
jgi:photosystem II stability/assembly factor-like uncharacterized protein